MTWLPETASGATPLDRVFGLRPDAYARFREMYAGLWDPAVIDPALLELCRLRIATVLGCDAERAIRYSDAVDAGSPKIASPRCRGGRAIPRSPRPSGVRSSSPSST